MANPLISGLGAFASAFLDEDDAQALQDIGELAADDINAEDQSAAPNLEPLNAVTNILNAVTAKSRRKQGARKPLNAVTNILNAVTNIDSPSQTSTAANQPATPPSNQLAFAPAQPIQGTKMPKPAFSTPSPAPSHESTPAPKPKMLNFGDALAQGLPQSWSIVPPTANIVQKPTKPK